MSKVNMGNITVSNGLATGFIGRDKIYIGRYNSRYNLDASPLKNPFMIKASCSREEVIKSYREYLIFNLTNNLKIKKEFDRLVDLVKAGQDINLVCWCKPLSCHGDVLKEFIEEAIYE